MTKINITTFGSVCSGIEAASFVLKPLGVIPLWLSEIDDFPCKFLQVNYASVHNIGDMNDIPSLIVNGKIDVPDMLCGGTPCQAFSLAGWREGIADYRGQLTLKFFDILNEIDKKRAQKGLGQAVCFWENVEGVLSDKCNAFGCFLSGLAGLDTPIIAEKWTDAGILFGKTRNVAWRVLDAKYFGLPQQRKRIYVVAGGKDFNPQDVLFEMGEIISDPFKPESSNCMLDLFGDTYKKTCSKIEVDKSLNRNINGYDIEIFRSYTDCLYAAYGTKWNGNAAAMNGSLFIAQNGRLRRLTPREAEKIMGFPDDYTLLGTAKDTLRYRAIGNSWAVNVVRWVMERLCSYERLKPITMPDNPSKYSKEYSLYLLRNFVPLKNGLFINASNMPYDFKITNLLDYIDTDVNEKYYISPAGCAGILRRKREKNMGMNPRLEIVLKNCTKN